MASNILRALIIEDSADDTILLVDELERNGQYQVQYERVETADAMLTALQNRQWDIVTADYSMPKFSGIQALHILRDFNKFIPFIIISGSIGEDIAVDAMKAGANDYIMKNNLSRLVPAIRRELRESLEHKKQKETELLLLKKEEQLRHSQKLEAIGRLAGGIAHDFNNILSVIALLGETALQKTNDVATLRKSLSEIMKAQNRASQLVKQLLSFSSKQAVSNKVISIHQILTDIQSMMTTLLGETLTLKLNLNAQSPHVLSDRGYIEQVIMNLIVNARDAILPNAGTISIETNNIEINEDHAYGRESIAPGEYVEVQVIDNGHGMSEDIKEKIFEPFFTTKGLDKGTGLGLSTVYGIIQQAKGRIFVKSSPGHGTTFTIILPLANPVACEPQEIEKPHPHSHAKNEYSLLVVEDENILREIICNTLREQGYQVFEATSPEEACKLAEAHPNINLIVTDVIMPQMTGPNLARLIKNKCPCIKTMFISGYAEAEILERGADISAHFLSKPFSTKDLLDKIREILD